MPNKNYKVLSCFYLKEDKDFPKKEKLDFILQLIQWMQSSVDVGLKPHLLIFDKNIKDSILHEITIYPRLAKMFLLLWEQVQIINYNPKILRIVTKEITSAQLEFFGPAYFSALKIKGLWTHIDMLFIEQPRWVYNGCSQDLVRNKHRLYQGRAKHYKTFKYKRVFFTWAIFLGINNFKHYIKLYKDLEKSLKQNAEESFLINNYRNLKREGIRLNRLNGFSYNYYNSIPEKAKAYHYDSFFKEHKALDVPGICKEIKLIQKNLK